MEDVIRKLKGLHIAELKRKEFLLDIFGSDARKEVGLMDAFTPTEFDMLDSLYPLWKKREINSRVLLKEESTEFYPYFLMNASLDMKTRMIRSVRENVSFTKTTPNARVTGSRNGKAKVSESYPGRIVWICCKA